eukprot:TRINITY_DN3185_c0_g1_i1.p1 TRINITY_DN3185_c0_g1~~TRINITY_DN3185_c0_g1_i1.p1  ORF type:complete len:366 (-),score=86.32 TRINITY_DN3185_c0_g1_i1:206-1303(-)
MSSDWSRKSSIWNNSSSLTDKGSARFGGPVLHEHPHGAGLFPGYHHVHHLPVVAAAPAPMVPSASSVVPPRQQSSTSAQLESLIQTIQGLQVTCDGGPAAQEKITSLEVQLKQLQKMLSSNSSSVNGHVADGLDELDVKHLIGGNLFDEVVEEKKVSAASSSSSSYGRHAPASSALSPSRNTFSEDRNELKRNHSVVAASKKKEAEPVLVPSNVFSSSSRSTATAGINSKFSSTPRKPPKSGKHVHEGSPAFGGGSMVFNDSATTSSSALRDDSASDDSARHKKPGAKAGYVCHLCKAVGEHKIHECPSRFQIQKAGKKFVCKLCQGPHIVYKCPQFKHSVPSAGYICKICGEDGDHWFYNCPHK